MDADTVAGNQHAGLWRNFEVLDTSLESLISLRQGELSPDPLPDNEPPAEEPEIIPDADEVEEPVLPKPDKPSEEPPAEEYAPVPGRIAYLTFNDGPSKNTPLVLDVLQEYNIKATFFVIGKDTEFGHSMYRRIVHEGHAIGNHTYSHD